MNTVYTDDGFKHWVKCSSPGDKIVYYTGFLMLDKERLIQRGIEPDHFPQDIKLAKTAWHHYTYGDVLLVQKRRGNSTYDYVAVKA